MNQQHFIQMSCEIAGSATKLANAIGVTPGTITQWRLPKEDKYFRQVAAERCPQIEAATGGLVRCEDLRPDVQWSVLRGTELDTAQAQQAQPATQPVAQGE